MTEYYCHFKINEVKRSSQNPDIRKLSSEILEHPVILEDENFEITALRETHEEIGISPERIEIVKAFTQLYIPPSNFMVHPFLGICREEITFIPEPSEVAGIIELPLSVFLDETIIVQTKLSTSYAENISIPAFEIEKHIVWGATAMILSELKVVLKTVLEQEL